MDLPLVLLIALALGTIVVLIVGRKHEALLDAEDGLDEPEKAETPGQEPPELTAEDSRAA